MKRLLNILVFICLSVIAFAQEDTHIVDSLRSVLVSQEGREKVLTMIELTWEFYDISYDDCLDWGEKAIKEAQNQDFADLEAKANYVLGIQYAYHGDLDLAKEYLQKAYTGFVTLGDEKNAFESLWNIATYEFTLGSIDTAYHVYEEAEVLAKRLNDTSAWAYVISNMGLIKYYRGEMEESYDDYVVAEHLFRAVGDRLRTAWMESSLATIFVDKGQIMEAKWLFLKIIPVFEEFGDYYHLVGAYKNLGHIYEYKLVKYDSAMLCFQKAMDMTDQTMAIKEYEVFANNEKSGVLVEMANVMALRGEYDQAVESYKEALRMSEACSYYSGQMEACAGMLKVYSKIGKSDEALKYYQRFLELEQRSGISKMRSSLMRPLMLTYARLRLYDELDAELEIFEEDYMALLRENADVYEQNRSLIHNSEELLQKYESQNNEIETLQTQRNRYRLAFFGLLCIGIAAVVFLVTYKIVGKKREKV